MGKCTREKVESQEKSVTFVTFVTLDPPYLYSQYLYSQYLYSQYRALLFPRKKANFIDFVLFKIKHRVSSTAITNADWFHFAVSPFC